jgi:hypothetical protein
VPSLNVLSRQGESFRLEALDLFLVLVQIKSTITVAKLGDPPVMARVVTVCEPRR